MRAWRVGPSGDPGNPGSPGVRSQLVVGEIPKPDPGPGEVLVRVHAAGVTTAELGWHPTTHTKAGATRVSAVPGHEFSGVVAAVGPGTTGVAAGQPVYGMNDWFDDGATADYCITRPEWIAPKPPRLTHAEAASVPIGALTAWQGLFDRAQLRAGERVLVHGGSGAVGIYAVLFARRHGARVVATASARNEEFLLRLGCERVIDYKTGRFEESVKGIDVVFDTVGGKTLERSWGVLAPNGRLVTIASDGEGTRDERTKKAFFIVEPRREQLVVIADLIEAREIQPVVDAVAPFTQAGAAYAGEIKERLGRGKVVVKVTC
ncbi:MAG: NADP-dependent oxidoreductase [Planctomycetota bacterium]|nr:NADP-dependent oxidoreductase [Planctomycetota bacterium]